MQRLAVLIALSFFSSLVPASAADKAAPFFDDSKVHEIRIYFDFPNWYNTLYTSHNSDPTDPYFPARFVGDGVEIAKIGARFKGNSSFRRNGVKKPIKLDFNEYDDDATFLGLKKLNLHNGDIQPDFMHEKLFLDFAARSIPAMRAVHTRLYINDAYYGLYLAVEQPNKQMMQRAFGDDEDGNLWEAGESVSATMEYLGSNPASYYTRYELKTNEEANDYSGLINMLNILNNTPIAQLPARLEPVMDIENIINAMALNALFTNLESYVGTAGEYFLYQRSRDNRFVHIHWDTNETFGSTGDGTPRLANPFTMDPFYMPAAATGGPGGSSARPLLTKLWAVPQYRRLYIQSLARFTREGFDESTFSARSQQLASLIRSHYEADPNRQYTMGQFEQALTTQVTANGFTSYGITQFVRERLAYLKPYLAALAQPSDIRLNEIVAVNSGANKDEAGDADSWVEIHNLGPGSLSTSGYFLTDDPSNPTKWSLPSVTLPAGENLILWLDGEPSEGAAHASFKLSSTGGSLYLFANAVSSTTPLDTITYPALAPGRAYARTGLFGSTWSETSTPTHNAANLVTVPTAPVTPSAKVLYINELMADNSATIQDPDEPGAFEDWFEIYNPGAEPIDMSGMYISDSTSNPTKWQVPAGVTIPARGFLLFWADGDTTQGSLHTSWSLSKSGESISIYDTDGTTRIDTVAFGAQTTDVSYGRTTDGAADWTTFSTPTPGASNAAPPAVKTLFINEFMADNSTTIQDPDEPGAFEDWFEIYNPTARDIDMSGMYITDSPLNPTKWQVPAGVTIPAHGFLLFWADGDTAQGSLHTNWSLGKSGESISIFDTDGTTLIDSITFAAQSTDVSYGRSTDGGPDWALFSTPTPGASNLGPTATWILNTASRQPAALAPASLATAIGEALAPDTLYASTPDLPAELGGVTITIKDSTGATHSAQLNMVSPASVDFFIPANVAPGRASVTINKSAGGTLQGDVLIASTGPGLYSADGSGTGVGMIAVIHRDESGADTWSLAFSDASGAILPVPISMADSSKRVYLQLYGTGIRPSAGAPAITATVGGASVPVESVNAHSILAGIDEVRIGPLPWPLAAKGTAAIEVTASGRTSNAVTVTIQ